MIEAMHPGPHRPGGGARAGQRRSHRAGAGARAGRAGHRALPRAADGPLRVPGRRPAGGASVPRACARSRRSAGMPELWLLGSSTVSGTYAAELGWAFSFAHFISPEGGEAVIRNYRERFHVPRRRWSEPRANMGVSVTCAETEEEARELSWSRWCWRIMSNRGMGGGIPSVQTARAFPYSERELAYIEHMQGLSIHGSPAAVPGEAGGVERHLRRGRVRRADDHARPGRAPALVRVAGRGGGHRGPGGGAGGDRPHARRGRGAGRGLAWGIVSGVTALRGSR